MNRSTNRNWSVVALLYVIASTNSIAQMGTTPVNQHPVRLADALRARGVDTSPSGLIAALQSGDPTIRALASHKLAEDRDLDAIPQIEAALSAERDQMAGVDIASALWNIGDPIGLAHLQFVCMDASQPISVVGRAVRQIAIAQVSHPQKSSIGKCAAVLLDKLERPDDQDDRLEMLSLLPAVYSDAPKVQSDRITADAQGLLTDPTPAIRMAASRALAQIGAASSLQAMQNAVDREQDAVVKASLQSDLTHLEGSARSDQK